MCERETEAENKRKRGDLQECEARDKERGLKKSKVIPMVPERKKGEKEKIRRRGETERTKRRGKRRRRR